MTGEYLNTYGYMENGTDNLLMPNALTDDNSVGYGGGVESLTENSYPFEQQDTPDGDTSMQTVDIQSFYKASPTVGDGILTIKRNGVTLGSFSANQTTSTEIDINVPVSTSQLTNDSYFVSDSAYTHTDNNFTDEDLSKLEGIEAGAQVNVQADWNQTDTSAQDYIKNKPLSRLLPETTSSDGGKILTVNSAGTGTEWRSTDDLKAFKGWFDDTTALSAAYPSPKVGDYAYIKGANASDPAAIYECTTAGIWSDSERTVDTSSVQTFETAEEVNDVAIINDLVTGGEHDVLSAEAGKLAGAGWKKISPISSTPGYLTASGSISGPSSTVVHVETYELPQDNTVVLINTKITSSSSTICNFYDSEGNVILSGKYRALNVNYDLSTALVFAPKSAVTMNVTCTNDYNSIVKFALANSFMNLNSTSYPLTIKPFSENDTLQEAIYNLRAILDTGFEETPSFTDLGSYYVSLSTGNLSGSGSTAKRCQSYAVSAGDVFLVTCGRISSSAAVIAFYNNASTTDSTTYMKKYSLVASASGTKNYLVVVPHGAVTMIISSINSSSYGYRVRKASNGIDPSLLTDVDSVAAALLTDSDFVGDLINTVTQSILNPDYIAQDYVTDPDTNLPVLNPLAFIKETPGYTSIFRTMGVIGGSMSTGFQYDSTGNGHNLPDYSCIQFIARLCNSEGHNFSRGGLSARSWPQSDMVEDAVSFKTNPCQMYLIQVGNNDLAWHGDHDDYVLGTISDINGIDGTGTVSDVLNKTTAGNLYDNYANTFYGQVGKILACIRYVQPKAHVFLSTFLNGYNSEQSLLDFDFNAAIRNIVNYYGDSENRPLNDQLHYHLIDIHKFGKPYSYYGTGIHTGTRRSSHLLATGYLYWAYEYCTYIDWIVKNNMSDFNDVAFIDD